MPVRSTHLGSGIVAANQTVTVVSVPDGVTVLVKSLYGVSGAAAAGLASFSVQYPPAVGQVIGYVDTAPNKSWRWDGWLALDPGAQFRVFAGTAGPFHYYCSGTVLPGVAPGVPTIKPAGADSG